MARARSKASSKVGTHRADGRTSRSGGSGGTRRRKRRNVRFPVMLRVDYAVDGRKTFSFASDISAAGLFLRNAKDLTAGQELEIGITRDSEKTRIALRGAVRRVVRDGADAGAALEFLAGQESAIEHLRGSFAAEEVKKLEETLARSLRNVPKVVTLCSYYIEVGRTDDAVALCRAALAKSANSLELHEQLAVVSFERARQLGADAWPQLGEIERLIATGRVLGQSDIIDEVERDLHELSGSIEQRKQEERRREDQLRAEKEEQSRVRARRQALDEARAEARQELQQQRDALDAEVVTKSAELAAAAKAVETERVQLESTHSEIAGVRARLHEQEDELAVQAAALAAERESLAQTRKRLAVREDELGVATAAVLEQRQALAEERRAVAAEADTLIDEAADLEAAALSEQVEQLRTSCAGLDEQLASARGDIEERDGRLEATLQRVTELEADVGAARGSADDLRAKLRAVEDRIGMLISERDAERQAREELSATLASVEARLASAKEEGTRAKGRLGELRKGLNVRHAALESDRMNLERERMAHAKEKDERFAARAELVADRKAHAKDRDQLARQRAELLALRNELVAQKEQLSEERAAIDAAREARASIDPADAVTRIAMAPTEPKPVEQRRELEELRRRLVAERDRMDGERRQLRQRRQRIEAQERALAKAKAAVDLEHREVVTDPAGGTTGDEPTKVAGAPAAPAIADTQPPARLDFSPTEADIGPPPLFATTVKMTDVDIAAATAEDRPRHETMLPRPLTLALLVLAALMAAAVAVLWFSGGDGERGTPDGTVTQGDATETSVPSKEPRPATTATVEPAPPAPKPQRRH